MLKNLAVLAVAVAALALGAPAATADAPSYDCRLRSVQQDDVTGSAYRGVLAGVIVHAEDSAVSIRCRVEVNGVTQAQTPVGSGTTVAATHQEVSFAVGGSDVVRLCADHSSGHGSGTTCIIIVAPQIPPQILYDTIDALAAEVFQIIHNSFICSLLKLLAGNYSGVLVINSQGDVYLNGEPQWDCPPYDIVWD
ncbi:MAG TPA: hypothetical protein VNA20_08305 [Frankiaceae bacterium]|nr:hypothetical protein [Frankiaceae bacterium]